MNFQAIIIFASIPIYLIVVYLSRKYREWLLYYVFGAFGFTLITTYLLGHFHLDDILVAIEVFHTNIIVNFFNIPSQALSAGRLQLAMKDGWSILQIGIECSAVLEMSAIAGLLIFYPVFSVSRKIIKITFGLVATYIINLIRMFIIVAITYYFGTNFVFIAHAVVGRLFFFICVIVLYWFLITRPTIGSIGYFLRKGLKITRTTILREPRKRAFVSNIFMVLISLSAVSLAAVSFAGRSEWKTAFQKRMGPLEQKIAEPIKEELPLKTTDIKEIIGKGKVMNFTPEVLGEKKEGIALIPAITVLKTADKWLCIIRNKEESTDKEFYYFWLNTKNNQEIILGPVKEFVSEISGSIEDDWQCFVATSREELDKLK